MRIQNSSRPSFSKGLVAVIIGLTVLITIYSFVAMLLLNNIDGLAYLIPAVFGECAVITGFYSYKAKAENTIKLDILRRIIDAELKKMHYPKCDGNEEADDEYTGCANDFEEEE